MWAVLRKYVITAIVVVSAWVVAVLALNNTVFSPANVVTGYLNSLEEGDVGEAMARAGLDEPPSVLPDLSQGVEGAVVTQTLAVDDTTVAVTASYLLGGIPSETVFTLSRLPRTWGLFDRFEFGEFPLGKLRATISGAEAVTINGVTLPEADTARGVDVLYPGRYTLSWSSGWVEADTINVAVENSTTQTVELTAMPSGALIEQAEQAVEAFLDTCTSQAVLQPAGCPFGVSITDRVVGDVVWEVNREAAVILTIADDEETILVDALGGEVTLSVSLQSLFDGAIRDYVEVQTIDVTGRIVGLPDNEPQLIID